MCPIVSCNCWTITTKPKCFHKGAPLFIGLHHSLFYRNIQRSMVSTCRPPVELVFSTPLTDVDGRTRHRKPSRLSSATERSTPSSLSNEKCNQGSLSRQIPQPRLCFSIYLLNRRVEFGDCTTKTIIELNTTYKH